VKIKIDLLFKPAFWDAFNSMMRVEAFIPADKLLLVKCKRYLSDEYLALRETFADMKQEQQKELLEGEMDLPSDYVKLFDTNNLAEFLTAAQLFELSAITQG